MNLYYDLRIYLKVRPAHSMSVLSELGTMCDVGSIRCALWGSPDGTALWGAGQYAVH